MRSIRTLISSLLFAISVATYAAPAATIGEKANYQLDKNSARTTSMVSSGTALAKITKYLPDHKNGPSYEVSLDYDINVSLYGRQQGTTQWDFPEEFFTPQFMEKLRVTKHYETPDYKINYEGTADVANLDGTKYPGCDKILIYDVKIPNNGGLKAILMAAAGFDPEDMNIDDTQIEDLKIRAHMHAGVPVLAAAKIDISGKVQGFNAKAGFDFKK